MSKQEITKKIAEELFDFANSFGDLISDIIFTPYGKAHITRIPRSTYIYNLKRFEKYGLIKKARKSYGAGYKLTPKAKKLRRAPAVKTHRNDELSTIIMFDIPEHKHNIRDNFRRYLQKNGYTQIQKSVFISPFRVFDEMLQIVEEMGIKNYVTIISGKIDRF